MQTHMLPPGTYYVGDPCYVFNQETWDRVLDMTSFFQTDLAYEIDGQYFAAASTAYGDGTYSSNFGDKYPVDAGLIGVVDIRLVESQGKLTAEKIVKHSFGTIMSFDKPFSVDRQDNHIIIEDISINTGSDDYDEDEFDDE